MPARLVNILLSPGAWRTRSDPHTERWTKGLNLSDQRLFSLRKRPWTWQLGYRWGCYGHWGGMDIAYSLLYWPLSWILMFFEQEFSIEIPDKDADAIHSGKSYLNPVLWWAKYGDCLYTYLLIQLTRLLSTSLLSPMVSHTLLWHCQRVWVIHD